MRMRILQVHTRYRQAGGEDAAVRTERQALQDAGHTVGTYETANPEDPVRTALGLLRAPWNSSSAGAVRTAVESFGPDVAHVHNTWFALSPSVVAAIAHTGVPVVMTLHNYRLLCANGLLFRDGRPCTDCVGTHPGHAVVHRCYRGSSALSAVAGASIALHQRAGTWNRHVDLFLTPSEAARRWLASGGLPAERIRVKPNSVHDPGPRNTLPSASGTFLAVGRISAERGIETLLRAWERASVGDFELVVVGDGPLRGHLEAIASRGVRFTGALPAAEVRERMLDARALLFPTNWYEPFGLVAAEAMAAGLPVVGSDIGAVPEVLGDDGGWLVPPGDAPAWVTALETVMHDDTSLDERGAAGRRRFEALFSAPAAAAELERAYRDASSRLRTPRN
jgi:glycosyltransferase involved in cell wall biosynthesis